MQKYLKFHCDINIFENLLNVFKTKPYKVVLSSKHYRNALVFEFLMFSHSLLCKTA